MSKREGPRRGPSEDGKRKIEGQPDSVAEAQAASPGVAGGKAEPETRLLGRASGDLRTMLRESTDFKAIARSPYGLAPVLVFTLISAVHSVDVRITGIALPVIQRELDFDLFPLVQSFLIVNFFLIFIVLGFGYLFDRIPRAPFVGFGVLISGIFSLLTSRVQQLSTLVATRAADGTGDIIEGAASGPLLADYYPPEIRGKVFALFGVVARVLSLVAPLTLFFMFNAGLSWRTPFLVTGPLLLVAGVIAVVVLREPVRGYMERRSLGLSEEEARQPEEPVSLGESWRTIWSIRTLRRLFFSDIPGGMGSWAYGFFFSLFLFERYGFGPAEIALMSAVVAAFSLPFGFFAGGMVDVFLRRRPQRLLLFTGFLYFLSGFAVWGIAAAPPVWVLIVVFTVFGAASILTGPARSVLYIQILPAHVRAFGSSIPVLAQIPSTILRVFTINWFLVNWGVTGGIVYAAPFFILAGLIEMSAAGFFERDMRAAVASQAASQEWRRAKDAGRGKLLVCRDVDVEYDGVQVLFGVDFDVDEGDIIALLGTNGAGKSTLLKAISGTQEASSGAVVFDGRDITHMPPHEVAARGVIHMPGGRGIFPDLTVRENLLLANWLADEKEGAERLKEVLEMFPVLRQRWNERAQLLSGGEQQMLSLSQAFLSRPRLLMIDELSLGLSPAIVEQLIEIVRKIHERGTTIIVVEQSVNVALTLAEKAIFMEKGEVRFVGQTEELLRRPDILRAVYVKGTGALTEGASASAVKGERERRRYEIEQARNILEVRDLSKSFGGVVAVDRVSFDLREGEALGLIGPNGAGKTTVFDLVSGYQIPDAGKIAYEGLDVSKLAAQERAKKGLVRRFQDARLFPALSVYENLLVALDQKLDVRSMPLTAMQLPQARNAERRVRRRAERLIELLELGSYRDKLVRELSTGLRRITDLACVLAAEPKVLMLDEPSTGIAQAESESLAPLLRRVRSETGCSMLIIEHDMPLISAISDELLAMDQGKVLMRGTPDEVLNDERVVQSYLGTSEDVIKRSGVRSK